MKDALHVQAFIDLLHATTMALDDEHHLMLGVPR
jgi:hypothetical protein